MDSGMTFMTFRFPIIFNALCINFCSFLQLYTSNLSVFAIDLLIRLLRRHLFPPSTRILYRYVSR
jgi:hypothetical protein